MRKIFKFVLCCAIVLASVVQCTTFSLAAPVEDDAGESSFPILCKNSTNIYCTGDCSSGVLNVILTGQAIKANVAEEFPDFYEIKYGSVTAYVQKRDFIIGDEIERYVKSNYHKYDCVVTVNEDSDLIDPVTNEVIGSATSGDSYLLLDDYDNENYLVTFDGNKAFISKNNAKLNINVKLICFASSVKEGSTGESLVQFASQFLGNPYVWGGTSLVNGTDCSGFTLSIFKNFGVELPRCSWQQATCGVEVKPDELQPGDLVFYNRNGKIGHVAIYIGDGKIIHAKGTKYGIVTDDVYYREPVSMRRIL